MLTWGGHKGNKYFFRAEAPLVFWGKRRIVFGAATLAILLGLWGALRSWHHDVPPQDPDNSRDTFVSPFQNVRPEVRYVGDAACAGCHVRQSETYHQHPMGRSLARVEERAGLERYDEAAHDPFEAAGNQFRVERRGEQVIHTVQRRDDQGVIAASEAEVHFAIGAGVRGYSYVIDRDGYLYQSPISWYTERQAWDLSPHLAKSVEQLYRPVQVACLFCHANHVEPVEQSGNHFQTPLFQGESIGCERCHGPGERHVQRRQSGEGVDGLDDSIVNPRRLEPALREAVCQQCHLLGVCRIVRRGRQPFDYRPGLPLDWFWSLIVRPAESSEQYKFASQVEQMLASRCYRASDGKLGCISCHDPHEKPAPDQAARHYRDRCLACHVETSCALTPAARREKGPEDNCTACHMGRINASNVAHMASTDHRILRRPDSEGASPRPGPRGETLLASFFHPAQETAGEAGRDLGVALMDLASTNLPAQLREQSARQALPLLEEAVRLGPDDAPAWQARGYALWLQGRKEDALAALETTLQLAPRREEALMYAAGLAGQLGRDETALTYWRRLTTVNPYTVRAHVEIARLLALRQEWAEAREACHKALRLDPFHTAARQLLIESALRTGHSEEADSEFATLLRLNPRDEAALRRWFDTLLR
jgi:Flp pilus assembly protein TadD